MALLLALLPLAFLSCAFADTFSAPETARALEAGPEIQTHLYALERTVVYLGKSDGSGGAIESMGNDLLIATPKGRIALVRPNGDVEYLDGRVPMNVSDLELNVSFDERDKKSLRLFRVADILLKELSPRRFKLYVTHHYYTGECNRFRLSSTTLSREAGKVTMLPSWRTIFDAEPCLSPHWFGGDVAGGTMLTDGPDHLLVTIGDHRRGWAESLSLYEQIPGSHMGKLVRVAIETGDTETLTLGHRNPQGLARDKDGNLWSTEHGPQGGDELNLLEPGGNYGWPHVSYGVDYGRKLPLTIEYEMAGRHDGFVEPVFSFMPSIAPTSLVLNDERWFPLWGDDLLIASLYGQSIFRVGHHDKSVKYVERIEVGVSIRDMTWMPDGRLALLYSRSATHVAFLSRSKKYCDEESRQHRDVYAAHCGDRVAANLSAESRGERLYGRHCGSCHRLDHEQHGSGPSLLGVIGRRAGSGGGYDFSDAFGLLDHVWTEDSLVRFIMNPTLFAPGTSMPQLSIVTQPEAAAIVYYIGYIGDLNEYQSIVSGEPVIRSTFDLYLTENRLTYVKAPCARADTEAKFFLHVIPDNPDDLPDSRKQYDFDNLDFDFDRRGAMADGKCMATVPLPDYAITGIRTGQFIPGDGQVWKAEFPVTDF